MPRTSTILDPALLERLKGLSLVARRVVEGALHGLHRSPLHGLSIEFAQHREYTPGDELKHLDWKVIGRSDRYVVKQYQQETNLRALIVVDCSRSMAFGGTHLAPGEYTPGGNATNNADPSTAPSTPNDSANQKSEIRNQKFAYARTLAAALAYLLIQQGDSVGLVLTADRIVKQVAPRATPGQVLAICHALEAAQPAERTDLRAVLTQLAARLRRRSLVILLSDLFDEPEGVLSALGQLHHGGHEVIVFQTLDPREISFELGLAGQGVTVLRDMETGAEFEAEPLLIRDLVRAEVQRFFDVLDTGARQHGLHLVRCPTDQPVEQVLTAYLHSRLKGKRR